MSIKHESIIELRLFYAFVDLEPELPVTYIVPSRCGCRRAQELARGLDGRPGARSQQRNDNPMRRIKPAYPDEFLGYSPGWLNEWRERWDLLLAPGELTLLSAGGSN